MNPGAAFRPVLVILEGINDIEFLLRLSQRLHAERAEIANLALLHAHRQILFVPTGGGNFCEWAVRFQALGLPGISSARSRSRAGDRPSSARCATRRCSTWLPEFSDDETIPGELSPFPGMSPRPVVGKSDSETTSASAPCWRTTGMNEFLSTPLGNRSCAVPVGGCLSRQTVVESPGRRANDRHTFGRARFGGRSAPVAGGDRSKWPRLRRDGVRTGGRHRRVRSTSQKSSSVLISDG